MTLLASVMLLASACTGKQASEKTASGLEPANFRTEVDGKQTDLFVLENKNGMEVCITNFGGRICFLSSSFLIRSTECEHTSNLTGTVWQ